MNSEALPPQKVEAPAAPAAPPPSIEHLCLNTPLYAPTLTKDRNLLSSLRRGTVQFDAYCIGCEKSSTFKTMRSQGSGSGPGGLVDYDWMLKPADFILSLSCQRAGHLYIYNFKYTGEVLLKFGQYPSIEDIAGSDIIKFKGVLKGGYFAELRRATGLASHGIGIGSFVYLRRIFEHLILDHRRIFEESGHTIDGFDAMRMDEKISALRNVLPPALVKNKATYAILSSGIHTLDEDTCRKYFPVVKAAIIEILEQDLRAQEAARAANELEVAIAALAGEVREKTKFSK